jgi:hypothetical protein
VCSSDLLNCVELSDGALIKCRHELCVKVVNKFNIQSKTPSRVTYTRDNIFEFADMNQGDSVKKIYNSFT